ncbi:MAG: GntR family transcriptional regulator [Acidobacteriota bacterium]|jgi:GntR family transcriptional regulator
MQRKLVVNPSDAVPVWKQIEEGVRRLVAAGAMARGAPVPSVRELAKDLRVNPATVAKAYRRLADAGVLKVRRGEGTFVEDNPPVLRKSERRSALREGADRYATHAATLGADRDEAVKEFDTAWKDLGGDGGRP